MNCWAVCRVAAAHNLACACVSCSPARARRILREAAESVRTDLTVSARCRDVLSMWLRLDIALLPPWGCGDPRIGK